MATPRKKSSSRRFFRLNSIVISMVLSLLVLFLYVTSRPEIELLPLPLVLEILEAKALDLRFRLRGPKTPGDTVIIVAVDEKTEDQLGRWHSSGRRWIAELVDILHAGGVRVIGFDFTLAEPDEGTAAAALDDVKARLTDLLAGADERSQATVELLASLTGMQQDYNYDLQLAEAIERAGNVVLGFSHIWFQQGAAHLTAEQHANSSALLDQVHYGIVKFPPGSAQVPLRLRHSYGVETNLPIFSEAAADFGHYSLKKDFDSFIRRIPMLVEYDGKYCPALALQLAKNFLDPAVMPVIHAGAQAESGMVNSIQFTQNITIPTDEQANVFVNYYGPVKSFRYYSLSDVIQGDVAPAMFHDKLVLVGFTANIYQDIHATVFSPSEFYGVEVIATVIENILNQEFLTRPEATALIDGAVIVALGLVLGIVLQYVHALRWKIVGVATAMLGVLALAHAAFLMQRVWLNITFPMLFAALDYVVITSYKYFLEEKKERIIHAAFEHYVSPSVVKRILEASEHPVLGQEQRVMSVLFSDIRGFTSFSETMSSQQLTDFLEEFFTPMVEIIALHDGTVDKYIGDAIMVFYGAPEDQPDHAVLACRTAVDMHLRLQELQVRWKARGLPYVNIGLGINSGEMSVGNIGARERFDYTILGDNVNLASRLEGINKQYGTNIIVSEYTYAMLPPGEFVTRKLDTVRVKGKKEPVTIYELLGYGKYFQQMQPLIEMFAEALAAYRKRQWDDARTIFQRILEAYPDDGPAALYSDRCSRYRREPPDDDWDGVYDMKTK